MILVSIKLRVNKYTKTTTSCAYITITTTSYSTKFDSSMTTKAFRKNLNIRTYTTTNYNIIKLVLNINVKLKGT